MKEPWLPPDVLRDPIAHRRWVAEAEAALFGGDPEPVMVGRFEIRERLGAGSVGVVYGAHDDTLQRTVALKLLHPSLSGVDPKLARARWIEEARAMARLSHPNVVSVHEVGTDGEHVFIVMERVAGVTLRAWTASAPRPWTAVLAAYEAAGRGLAAAHAAGLVHRDFKPDNVLVQGEAADRVMVTDFGVAAVQGKPGEPTIEGTAAYMAPEQRRGEAATPAADQFAFCVALHEALYGERPFPDDGPMGPLRAPKAPVQDIPTLLWTIVARGLSPRPEERWPSMDALLIALRPEPTQRHRTAVMVALMFLLAVVLTAAVIQLKMFWDYSNGASDVLGRTPPPGD